MAWLEKPRLRPIGFDSSVAVAVYERRSRLLTAGRLNTVGTVLDAVFALRRRVRIAPGAIAQIAFWTVVASSREALLDLDRQAFATQLPLSGQELSLQLRRKCSCATLDQSGPSKYVPASCGTPRLFGSRPEAFLRRHLSRCRRTIGTWPLSISGDLPIVLLRIPDTERLDVARQRFMPTNIRK